MARSRVVDGASGRRPAGLWWKGRDACSRVGKAWSINVAATIASRQLWTLICRCCICSMNMRPVALRPRSQSAAEVSRRFRSDNERPTMPHADPGVLHKGFGSLRRPVANLLEGAILDWRADRPERGTTGTNNRQRPLHTGGNRRWQGKRAARSHSLVKALIRQVPLTDVPLME